MKPVKNLSIAETVLHWMNSFKKRPLVIGISAPQGAGKSTLSSLLCKRLANSVTISIDDFYLRRHEQQSLAEKNPKNSYLQHRGYPGTHDIELGFNKLSQIIDFKTPVQIPRYDKSAYSGLGDRSEQYDIINTAPDFIFIEGWMLGFQPQTHRKDDPWLNEIDSLLPQYQKWMQLVDALVHLKPKDINDTIDWRIEAEEKMKATGKPGMTLEQVRNYIETFIPAYKRYEVSFDGPVLSLGIDKNRELIGSN